MIHVKTIAVAALLLTGSAAAASAQSSFGIPEGSNASGQMRFSPAPSGPSEGGAAPVIGASRVGHVHVHHAHGRR